jgi:hypothetical protein
MVELIVVVYQGYGRFYGGKLSREFVSACTLCEDKDFHRADPPRDFFLVFVLSTSTCVDTVAPSWTTVSIDVQ